MATLFFPLYIYPSAQGAAWTPLIEAARSNPGSKVLAVINPDNGPGDAINPDYRAAIQGLAKQGIKMAAYVHTSYGARAATDVESDVVRWTHQYPQVRDLFIDNVPNVTGFEHYYSRISSFAKSHGFDRVFGNPGTRVPASYADTVDTTIVYEEFGYPTSVDDLVPDGGRTRLPSTLGIIVHGVDTLDREFVHRATRSIEFICVTRNYESFPPYLGDLFSCLVRVP